MFCMSVCPNDHSCRERVEAGRNWDDPAADGIDTALWVAVADAAVRAIRRPVGRRTAARGTGRCCSAQSEHTVEDRVTDHDETLLRQISDLSAGALPQTSHDDHADQRGGSDGDRDDDNSLRGRCIRRSVV